MSAFTHTLRQAAVASTRRSTRFAQPIARRQVSGAAQQPHHVSPHHWEPPHYTLKERLQKFAPVEIAPLVAAVATVSAFAFVNIYWAFQRPEGELRLVPGRLNKKHQEVPPWEDERALQGKW
ncbi:hypothetical protein JCM8115_004530 [Rhodotorula mucilaginosa]|uniref:Uncharacterized protein n=1 Tax=Rhodotorula mucilaginosa TaxID=5537 RepID=A0A9P6W2E0_RHOMI|nr:hypothetical protein C6P46_003726 [Rhodotorula mucilaginosa]